MEQFFEFNKEKHQRTVELINGVLLLAEDYLSQNPALYTIVIMMPPKE